MPLLREDIFNDKHLEHTSEELYWSREEYHGQFSIDEFRPRIYQEIRRQKFVYYLEWKRAKKQSQRGMPPEYQESSEEESESEPNPNNAWLDTCLLKTNPCIATIHL